MLSIQIIYSSQDSIFFFISSGPLNTNNLGVCGGGGGGGEGSGENIFHAHIH